MIKVVCVGKIKENYLVDGIKEYLKRIEGFQKIEVVEVKEYNLSDISKNIDNEGENILEKITKDADRDFYMDALQAKSYGLIDDILLSK